ncbi:ATP-binding domain-containing protein [Pectobacterium odoriferum]|uniref:ATP-binding domain-containing protein n=1 Tax=Pectobacterium odoriferum TaxID=78398 RepID=UPI0027E5971C|nr:ATP-binding domain-containing protein [Pectobacterium odoriferum]
MRRQATTNEKDADVVVSTAHRSKGLEWDTVILNDDFSDITNLLLSEEARTDETNLLYVATTLARKLLVRNALLKLLCEQEEPNDIAEELLSGFELFVVKAAQ